MTHARREKTIFGKMKRGINEHFTALFSVKRHSIASSSAYLINLS